jgi:AraC family transcriptional regulator, regulatory protein of adaptative response / methylated-DNA-[protein]-cysteine methyltransferase
MLAKLPAHEELYGAFCRKDMSLDGIVFVAVRTTRIFCRPGCPAPVPLSRNVEFYRSAVEALAAGYRACKRCKPLERPQAGSAVVEDLLNRLAEDPSFRWSSARLVELGINPVTARRHFERRFGMSFLKYARSGRLAQAHAAIENGADVLMAQLDAGFESSSGFREAFAQAFHSAPSKAHNSVLLRADWIDTPLGVMIALTDERQLHLLEFVNRKAIRGQITRYQRTANALLLPGETKASRQLRRELDSYFNGKALKFECPIAEAGTPFQLRVWDALRQIGPGTTLSYSAIASKIGAPLAVRAVANANAMNRCAIIIPCHRVIGADGTLTGYAGGLPRKQWLLDHEMRIAGCNDLFSGFKS